MSRRKTIFINAIIGIMLCVLTGITFSINSSYVFSFSNNDVIYEGNRQSNKISLMFNVYSGSEHVARILDIMDSYDVKTTFFLGGIWVEKNINLVKEIVSRGHEIGNHGYLHLDQDQLDYKQNYDEIYSCHNLIRVHIGVEMNLFAPPSGAFNNATLESSRNLGYSTIMWSKDTIDWRDQDSSLIYSRATEKTIGGDLILMHPTEKTVEALTAILEFYKLQQLEVVTVSQNLLLTE